MGVLQNFLFGSIAIWTPVVPVAYSFWPKYSGGPDSIEVEIKPVSLDSQYNSGNLKHWEGVIKPKNCWSLERYNNDLWNQFRELIVCRDKDNPSKPNVYFYKLNTQERASAYLKIDYKNQNAKKVINLSFAQAERSDLQKTNLEINLLRRQKENMDLLMVSRWANVKNLNPYKECRLIKTIGDKPLMFCELERYGQHYFKSFTLT